MFAKLLKYDSRAVFKYWWIAALSSLGIAVLGGVCIQIMNVDYTSYGSIQTLATLSFIFAVFALLLMPFLTVTLVLMRFYRHFFTDEGYLTFTLPVRKNTLLDSKVMTGMIFAVVSILLFILDVLVMMAVGLPENFFDPNTWKPFGDLIAEFYSIFGVYGVVYTVLGILILLVATAIQVLFLFLCIMLATSIAKKHKLLAGIGIYYGASVAVSMVMQILSLGGVFSIVTYIGELSPASIKLCMTFVLLGILGILVAIAAGLYLVELYLLDRRLNLE